MKTSLLFAEHQVLYVKLRRDDLNCHLSCQQIVNKKH